MEFSRSFFFKVTWSCNHCVISNLHISLTLIGITYLSKCQNLITIALAEWELSFFPESRDLKLMMSLLVFKLIWNKLVCLTDPAVSIWWLSILFKVSYFYGHVITPVAASLDVTVVKLLGTTVSTHFKTSFELRSQSLLKQFLKIEKVKQLFEKC